MLPLEDEGRRTWKVGTLTYTLPGLVALFFWLLFGDFALSMRERSADPVVQLMVKSYKASSTYQSWLLTVLPSAIALVLAPIISYKSDRHRGRWGRRIPYLLIPAPIAAGAMIGLAYAPSLGAWSHERMGASSPGLEISVLSWIALFYTLFEFGSLTANLLIGALINDVVPRAMLGRFFGLFRAVSLAAGFIFNRWLLGWAENHFFEIFLAIGLLFGVGFTVMCFMVKEGQYPPPPEPTELEKKHGALGAAAAYFVECFSVPYYRLVFITFLVTGLSAFPFNRFSIPYAKSLGMPTETFGTLIAYSFVCSFVLAYPLGWLVDKFHALRLGIAAMSLYALVCLGAAIFVRDQWTFGFFLVAHTVITGTYFTVTAALGPLLYPKLKFGQFASAGGIVANLGAIGVGMVIGPFLDFTGNNYQLTWVMGACVSATAVLLLVLLYRRFMALGGPKGYVAPGS